MNRPKSSRRSYLGIREGDLTDKWYAKYWQPQMAPLPSHVTDALLLGPQPAELALSVAQVPTLLTEGHQQLENGYSVSDDGSMHVAVRTDMPGVTAEMWDWWFWWHSHESQRYRLWHPRAHMFAQWADVQSFTPSVPFRDRYIGRTSFVDEYLGATKSKLAIRFLRPSELGIDESELAATGSTAICARGGLSEVPLDAGYLVHHVRPIEGGVEMRSRFWLGGSYVAGRGKVRAADSILRGIGQVAKRTKQQGYELLVHCSQEMSHLATFLPEIYAEYLADHQE